MEESGKGTTLEGEVIPESKAALMKVVHLFIRLRSSGDKADWTCI